ncbi:MAG: hypothetical protein AAF585_04985, partial [Verrucomicrobiota bacterium]
EQTRHRSLPDAISNTRPPASYVVPYNEVSRAICRVFADSGAIGAGMRQDLADFEICYTRHAEDAAHVKYTKLSGWAAYSYLFATIFFFTIAIGGLFWTILHNATNSGWGTVVRRQMENIAGLIPFVFILMIPLLFEDVRAYLWEWEPKAKEALKQVEKKMEKGALEEKSEKWEKEAKPVRDQIAAAEKNYDLVDLPGEVAIMEYQKEMLNRELARLEAIKPTDASVRKYLMHKENYLLAHKWYGYFNWAYLRFFLCAGILIGGSLIFRKWSIKSDKPEVALKYFQRSRYWSSGFIFFFGTSFTFLVVDLLMTMNYEWFSTMWGVYLFAGSALNSMAVLIIIVTWLRSLGYLKSVVSEEHYHAMGKLLFAFTVFWAYIAFSQYFLIWYANITEETRFYLLRNSDMWNTASIVLIVGHFMLPFVVLLFQPLKKKSGVLAAAAVWTLLMHILDIYWIIIAERGPSLTVGADEPTLFYGKAMILDIAAFLGVAGILGFVFLHNLKRYSLYPCSDPRLEESVNLAN